MAKHNAELYKRLHEYMNKESFVPADQLGQGTMPAMPPGGGMGTMGAMPPGGGMATMPAMPPGGMGTMPGAMPGGTMGAMPPGGAMTMTGTMPGGGMAPDGLPMDGMGGGEAPAGDTEQIKQVVREVLEEFGIKPKEKKEGSGGNAGLEAKLDQIGQALGIQFAEQPAEGESAEAEGGIQSTEGTMAPGSSGQASNIALGGMDQPVKMGGEQQTQPFSLSDAVSRFQQ